MDQHAGPIFEVRDYHYDPERLDEYRDWAVEALDVLGRLVDIQGWWIDVGIPARVEGEDPRPHPHGAPNVTWMIRWDDMDEREAVWASIWSDADWKACAERHPGWDGYRQRTVRFLDQL